MKHNQRKPALERIKGELSGIKDELSTKQLPERFAFKLESTARKVIRLLPRKEIAGEIGVSEQVVGQWAAGVTPFPMKRQIEAIKKAKAYIGEWRELEDEIDFLMLTTFGNVNNE